MLEIYYTRDGIEDLRYFESEEEFTEWFERESVLCPDVKIIKRNLKEGKS